MFLMLEDVAMPDRACPPVPGSSSDFIASTIARLIKQ